MCFTGKGLFLSHTSARLAVLSDTGDALEAKPAALQSSALGASQVQGACFCSGEEKGSRTGEAE